MGFLFQMADLFQQALDPNKLYDMMIFQANAATVPEETNQREEETTQESPVVVEEKQANTEVDVKPTESKTAEPDDVFFPDEEDNKLAEEGDEEDKAPIEEDLKFTEDIENEDQAEEDIENEDQ